MSNSNEKLSVVLDEYTGDEACQSTLNEVIEDVNLQYQMRRYQMIGDVMRHELPDRIHLDLGHQIMTEIRGMESENNGVSRTDTVSTTTTSIWSWAKLKPFAGLAVAATVAMVTVSLWQTDFTGTQKVNPADNRIVSVEDRKLDQLKNLNFQGNAVTVSSSLKEGTRWSAPDNSQALQQKLNGYLVNHTEYSNSMQGLIPQARVAGFDSQQ